MNSDSVEINVRDVTFAAREQERPELSVLGGMNVLTHGLRIKINRNTSPLSLHSEDIMIPL